MDEDILEEYTLEEVKVEVTKYNVKYNDKVIETFDNKFKAESSITEKITRDKRINFLQSKLFETLREAYSINNETYDDEINDIKFEIYNLSSDSRNNNMTVSYKSLGDNKTYYEFDENFWIDDKCWDTFTDLMFERYGFNPSIPYYYWPK